METYTINKYKHMCEWVCMCMLVCVCMHTACVLQYNQFHMSDTHNNFLISLFIQNLLVSSSYPTNLFPLHLMSIYIILVTATVSFMIKKKFTKEYFEPQDSLLHSTNGQGDFSGMTLLVRYPTDFDFRVL